MGERIRVLITVKTYPVPSMKYDEVVCTAGVRDDGSFIRLYPIKFRYKPYWEMFAKYQWIEVVVEKNTSDPRPESFRPIGEIIPREKISSKNNWAERKKYVFKDFHAMCELEKKPQKLISLGLVRPSEVRDFIITATDRNWKPKYVTLMNQLNLFGPQRKPLEKIPYQFSYKFKCTDTGCKGHTKMIEDWEVGQFYRRMRDECTDEKAACEKVKERFLGEICSSSKDTHFFVGTVLRRGTWIILGTFWPKRERA